MARGLTQQAAVQLIKEVTSQGTTQQRKPGQASGSPAQPINDKQAAEGKIDYVRVRTPPKTPSTHPLLFLRPSSSA